MITRFNYSLKYNSNAVVREITFSTKEVPYFTLNKIENTFSFSYPLKVSTLIYGLGESVRGINKKGHIYISNNTDDPSITEDRTSLYASHNFIIINDDGKVFGAFFDTPNKVTYDLGYSDIDLASIKVNEGFELYIIEGKDELDVIKQFRELIGESYLAPYYAFGIAQSRWGYCCKDDIYRIINDYEKNDLPLDLIYLDIDCLDNYKDFSLNDTFKDYKEFVSSVKAHNVELAPIVDAAIKIDDNYPVYLECLEKKYYAYTKDDKPFVVGVWAGDSLFPDFFNEEASNWFAKQYQFYLDLGITSFWNDMNEPVLFYSKERITEAFTEAKEAIGKNLSLSEFWHITHKISGLQNNEEDYLDFFHTFNGEKVSHAELHNYYSYYMVKNTSKYLKEHTKEEGYLLFSRSSCIGSHRYAGIWTGDNASWWEHLLLNFKMMPSLNMCGYLYAGADLGGFGKNSTEDLLLRWLAFGIFSPLLRNHSSIGTKAQEFCYMKNKEVFKKLLSIRYALMPYIYHTYVDAMKNNKLLFTPLSFIYKDDPFVKEIEDELCFGESIILAPIFNQNVTGRYLYLPEDCLEVRMKSETEIKVSPRSKGHNYVTVNLDEVVFYIRSKHFVPLTKNAKHIRDTLNTPIYCLDNNSGVKEFDLFVPKANSYTSKKVKLDDFFK